MNSRVFFRIGFLLMFFPLMFGMKVGGDKLHFEPASMDQKNNLINFAIESNDIYQTRTVHRDIAQEVFDIDEAIFVKGVVEVLKRDGVIVGFFTLKASDTYDTCELGHLFVKAGLQKQGLGGILFQRAIDIAKIKGFKQMTWISDPDSKEFYLKKGAHLIGYDQNLLNPTVPVPLFMFNLL